MAKAKVDKKSKTYDVFFIAPHKHLKYIHDPIKLNIKTLDEALKIAGNTVKYSIMESQKYWKRKGSDGPWAIQITDSKGVDVCHIEFVTRKGQFDRKMTREEELRAEQWLK